MRRRFLLSTAIADFVALTIGVLVGSVVTFGLLPWEVALPGSGSIWPFISFLYGGFVVGSFVSTRMWAGGAPRPSYGRGLAIVSTALAVTAFLLVATRPYYSNKFLVTATAVWFIGVNAHRLIRRRRPWTEPMVIISDEKELIDDLRTAPHTDLLAVLDPSTTGEVDPYPTGVTIAVDLRAVLSDRMAQFVSSCALAGYSVRAMSAVYEEHTGRMPIIHLAEGWELSAPVTRTAPYIGGKAIVDILAVLVTIPIWVPLAGVIALAVRFTSPGPVIFKQVRIGKDGHPFTLYKFRTMVVDAEEQGPRFATKDDPRLTAVGRSLRRFRVDELPQLYNVLKGDLALVGPRPEQARFVDRFKTEIPFYSHRHLVRPGVTGWAQVNYGYADDQAETIDKLTYDLYYVKHMSPWLDLHVLGRSIWTVLSGFGAR